MSMNQLTLDELNGLEYPAKIEFDTEDQVYTVEFLDLPGCSAYGDTVEEAYKNAVDAKKEWLKVTVEQDLPVPTPSKRPDYSGRILLRLPTSLHAALSDKAHLYQSSLNQFMMNNMNVPVNDTVCYLTDSTLNWQLPEIPQVPQEPLGLLCAPHKTS
jgi:antitoxin HicB